MEPTETCEGCNRPYPIQMLKGKVPPGTEICMGGEPCFRLTLSRLKAAQVEVEDLKSEIWKLGREVSEQGHEIQRLDGIIEDLKSERGGLYESAGAAI